MSLNFQVLTNDKLLFLNCSLSEIVKLLIFKYRCTFLSQVCNKENTFFIQLCISCVLSPAFC